MRLASIMRNDTAQLIAGVLIGMGAVAAFYLFVNASAAGMGSGFKTSESIRHTHAAQFANANASATENRAAAGARCATFSGAKKTQCNIEAGNEEMHARSDARVQYKNSDTNSDSQPLALLKPARNIDVVLYRAHRQWPE